MTRIPTEDDFPSSLPLSLHYPSPREATTSTLTLLHGLGDTHAPFTTFARNLNLPGVLAISIRGTSPLPSIFLPSSSPGFHWGDDVALSPSGDIDADPGFSKAVAAITNMVDTSLINTCGWNEKDITIFGFGQGGALALGIAAGREAEFKGVVSIGGGVPGSLARQEKRKTKVMVVQGTEEEVESAKRQFGDVRVVKWRRSEVGMPRDREEILPIMKFFAERLNAGWA